MAQFQPPGLGKLQAEPFRPFHNEHGTHPQSLLLFLKEQFIGSSLLLKPVEIQVNQRWFALGVVL